MSEPVFFVYSGANSGLEKLITKNDYYCNDYNGSLLLRDFLECLLTHTPILKESEGDKEVLELAGKIRAMLSIYPPDDPVVETIKSSPVYQRVAQLVEQDIG